MSKRRPTAADRDLADYVRQLTIGQYRIDVYLYPQPTEYGFGIAELKREGQLTLNKFGPKRTDIYPVKEH